MMWCATEDMIADGLTKDLYGTVFTRHKDAMRGWKTVHVKCVRADMM